ncbi:hypothetical protein [Variovorax sp. IB41]|uniref:hypothetical protein n=1 Tax=Variovorax sp. IB41 TaxID=2779370 RepID=UPI0018E9062E|nr:hypothetical protein [Variovorax sp. IB41]MBJ2157052.1 hypothetical protein [Variovorax sp. IB41]
MTRNHLRWILILAIGVYAIAIIVAILLRRPFDQNPSAYYAAYKDAIPLVIAIPAAYLAFAFQRRNSYLQALRAVWGHMVEAIAAALAYTEIEAPTQEQRLQVLTKLSVAIEEVRGVFKNIPADGASDGWYPFEPIKQIHQEIRELTCSNLTDSAKLRSNAKKRIYDMWKASRSRLLAEFDRDKPTHHHAEYAELGPRRGTSAGIE